MLVGDVKVNEQQLIDKLEQLQKGGRRDPDLIKYNVGEDKPAKNVLRPVGMFESCRIHYVQDFIGDTEGVSRVPVCAGAQKCPICKVVKYLYSIGTEEARKRAGQMRSTERNYWNVIPRWEYEWDEKGERCLVLPFGTTARRDLSQVVDDYGNPGDLEEGFDMVYAVQRKSGGKWGNDYSFSPLKRMRKRGGRIVGEDVVYSTLTDEELEFEMVDLSKYVIPPTSKELTILAEIFEVETIGDSTPSRSRGEMTQDVMGDSEDEEEEDEEYLCFGDPDSFDEESDVCSDCDDFVDCRREVRKSNIRRQRQRRRR